MQFISLLELIGTAAFAMSGTLKAIKKDLDYYGIAIFALVTAIGGGIIRDILINRVLPSSLANPIFSVVSLLSAVAVVIFYTHISAQVKKLMVFDAIGLAAFTAIGAEVAFNSGLNQPFVVITLAILTGTGGGVIRDVFAGEIPSIFQKEFYAVSSLIGAIFFMIVHPFFGNTIAVYSSFAMTLVIRLYTMQKDINLKKVSKYELNN